jgi:hypothetical protein
MTKTTPGHGPAYRFHDIDSAPLILEMRWHVNRDARKRVAIMLIYL